jgi:4-amino-4-deoxy-L-arabinose transferase-like glycosyltransferase
LKYAILIAAIILIRLPFLNQAVTGDDNYYLASAEHAQIDPLHPNHTTYVFTGKDVDFRGYPHPPLNAWALAALLAIFGDVKEIPFHTAYLFFSILAVSAMWSLSKRFSPHPFWATAIFIAVPAFLINGNSFESDVPLVAFLLAGAASFIKAVDQRSPKWLVIASIFLGLSSLVAIQAVFIIPILLFYARDWKPAWLTALAPAIILSAWQIFEYFSIGRFPILWTTTYAFEYGLERYKSKLINIAGLTVHFFFIVFPLLIPAAIYKLRRDKDATFLLLWTAIFFLGAAALFTEGSARYLLPIAAPLALLVSRLPARYLQLATAAQLTLSLGFATANYQQWNAYRDFAHSLTKQTNAHRTWINAEWGLRWYLEADGARPIHAQQPIPAGDMVVTSELAYPVPYHRGGSVPTPIAQQDVTSIIPLRLIALDSHSGYSTAHKGILPFGISTGPIDKVRAEILVAKQPTQQYLPMAAPEADDQIISGIYSREGNNTWRWTAGEATVALKPPPQPTPLHIELVIHDSSPVRNIKVIAEGRTLYEHTYQKTGAYKIDTPATQSPNITLKFDHAFQVPGDNRELAVQLVAIGYPR